MPHDPYDLPGFLGFRPKQETVECDLMISGFGQEMTVQNNLRPFAPSLDLAVHRQG